MTWHSYNDQITNVHEQIGGRDGEGAREAWSP